MLLQMERYLCVRIAKQKLHKYNNMTMLVGICIFPLFLTMCWSQIDTRSTVRVLSIVLHRGDGYVKYT